MTTPAEELIAALAAYAPLVAQVGGRIRTDLALEGDDYPFIVIQRASFEKITGIDGSIHARRDTFQIAAWGGTRGLSSDVAELVDEALRQAGLDPDEADPDAIDPEVGALAVVLNVDIWTD